MIHYIIKNLIFCQFLVFFVGSQRSNLWCLFRPQKSFSLCPSPALTWLVVFAWPFTSYSYLQGRTPQVAINDSHFSKSQVTSDVSQGSTVCVNDLAKLPLLSSATLTICIDDILLSQEISSSTSMSTVQSNINYIVD